MQAKEKKPNFQGDVVPQFDKTLLGAVQHPIDPAKWDRVVEFYEKGKFRELIYAILEYVNSDWAPKPGQPEKTEFVIPHGSALVNLQIKDDMFFVSAPFLTLPSTHNVPLLRQIAEINLFPLNLSTIVLEEDRLIFKYSCPLALCEPYKIYDVMREICAYADAYDDEFIKQFGARRFHQPVLKHFQPKLLEESWQKASQYLEELEEYVIYFEKRRLSELCLDMMIVIYMKFDYYLNPQGLLRTDIEKAVNYMQDQEIPPAERLRKGHDLLKQLREYKKEDILKCLYVAETFIPQKFNFTGEMIESYFESFYDNVKKELAGRDYTGATLTIQLAYMNLIYYYMVPDDVKTTATDALLRSSRKSWEEAASILWESLDNIINHRKPRRMGGLLGALFKRK